MDLLETAEGLKGEDPGRWGHSMANFGELLLSTLDAVDAKTVAEVGAYAGDLTAVLLEWAAGSGAAITAVDPLPQPELQQLAADNPALNLLEQTGADALATMDLPDALVIDGDHNYFTVMEELKQVGLRVSAAEMPLLLFHDVCWPHGRRDSFYAPERVPDEYSEGIEEGVGVFPGEPGVTFGGLPYKWAKNHEGGERNGVLTAIEDFVATQDGVRLAVLPMFFGFGLAWHEDAPWAAAVAALVDPWDMNPIVARLEANRVFHLANHHRTVSELSHEIWDLRGKVAGLEGRNVELEAQADSYEEILRSMSSAKLIRAADGVRKARSGGRQSWLAHIDELSARRADYKSRWRLED